MIADTWSALRGVCASLMGRARDGTMALFHLRLLPPPPPAALPVHVACREAALGRSGDSEDPPCASTVSAESEALPSAGTGNARPSMDRACCSPPPPPPSANSSRLRGEVAVALHDGYRPHMWYFPPHRRRRRTPAEAANCAPNTSVQCS